MENKKKANNHRSHQNSRLLKQIHDNWTKLGPWAGVAYNKN